jgi:metallo-beta-lactamase family protein
MSIKLQFLGAAQNVTGSRYLLQVNDTRLLVDCGLYQERQYLSRNWEPLTVRPDSINLVLLTHAHLDHCGLLPRLARDGFTGKIYCTQATADLARIILLDSAKLQEEDAKFKLKRHLREGRQGPYPEVPLYTTAEAQACFGQFAAVNYKQAVEIAPGIEAIFSDAGHVLGSSFIKVNISEDGQATSILFSGDVGRPHKPIVRDPVLADEADYILIESTYGDRVHDPPENIKQNIAEVINSTKKAGGNIIVPSFALERSQEVMYYINQLLTEGAIPKIKVFVDSPMAAEITKVFRQHGELFDDETTEFIKNKESPFNFPGLKMTDTTEQSKAINRIKGTIIVIAGSGMCTGGRIKHHLINNITNPKSSIMFVGYQATGTLGRQIVDG